MWWLILIGGFLWWVVGFRFGMQSARALRKESWPERMVIGGGVIVGGPAMILAVFALDLLDGTEDWPWFVQVVVVLAALLGIPALLFGPGLKMNGARKEAQEAKNAQSIRESQEQTRATWYRNVTDGTPWPGDLPTEDESNQ